MQQTEALLNHLVGAGEHALWHVEAKCLGGTLPQGGRRVLCGDLNRSKYGCLPPPHPIPQLGGNAVVAHLLVAMGDIAPSNDKKHQIH
jgi:hypothetical protein